MFKARFNGPPSQSILIKQRGNNALLYGSMRMPQKFNPSNGGSEFSMARNEYIKSSERTPTNKELALINKELTFDGCNSGGTPTNKVNALINKERTFDGCNNDQSGYIQRRKMMAVGKGSVLGNGPISFRSSDVNTVNTRLQRCRSGGCTAPAKKGAIANSYKSGGGSTLTGTGNATLRIKRDLLK